MGTLATNSVAILDVCQVTPASDSPELSFPLTHFDTNWLKFNPVESVYYYRVSDLTRAHFDTFIVPNLKRSLSLVLTDFLPLAGRLIWPSDNLIPSIYYKQNDSVSLTIAESLNSESFSFLTGDKPFKATESRHCVPKLHASDSEAAVISFQATLFANHGLTIGIAVHHAILDGNSATSFLKAWAYINKLQLCPESSLEEAPHLSPELIPFLDRSVIQDPDRLSLVNLEFWDPNHSKSLSLLPVHALDPALVRATFVFSTEDVRKLRDLVVCKMGNNALHLSTFVLVYSYTLTCLIKAKNMQSSSYKIRYICPVDCRARLDPPIPRNYSGNCFTASHSVLEAETVKGEDGFVVTARSVSDGIQEFAKISVYENCKRNMSIKMATEPLKVGVTGSPRFDFYKTDFGWGRPLKVEVTSIDRTGAISMTERRDGSSGGMEIGLVLTKEEMDVFETVFDGGLRDLSG